MGNVGLRCANPTYLNFSFPLAVQAFLLQQFDEQAAIPVSLFFKSLNDHT